MSTHENLSFSYFSDACSESIIFSVVGNDNNVSVRWDILGDGEYTKPHFQIEGNLEDIHTTITKLQTQSTDAYKTPKNCIAALIELNYVNRAKRIEHIVEPHELHTLFIHTREEGRFTLEITSSNGKVAAISGYYDSTEERTGCTRSNDRLAEITDEIVSIDTIEETLAYLKSCGFVDMADLQKFGAVSEEVTSTALPYNAIHEKQPDEGELASSTMNDTKTPAADECLKSRPVTLNMLIDEALLVCDAALNILDPAAVMRKRLANGPSYWHAPTGLDLHQRILVHLLEYSAPIELDPFQRMLMWLSKYKEARIVGTRSSELPIVTYSTQHGNRYTYLNDSDQLTRDFAQLIDALPYKIARDKSRSTVFLFHGDGLDTKMFHYNEYVDEFDNFRHAEDGDPYAYLNEDIYERGFRIANSIKRLAGEINNRTNNCSHTTHIPTNYTEWRERIHGR